MCKSVKFESVRKCGWAQYFTFKATDNAINDTRLQLVVSNVMSVLSIIFSMYA